MSEASPLKALDGLSVTPRGRAVGWALDPATPLAAIEVDFVADDEKAKPFATTKAAIPGFDGENPGDHAFELELPKDLRDGKTHRLFAFAKRRSGSVPFAANPVTFMAYVPTATGSAFFEKSIAPLLAKCAPCHKFTYEKAWEHLVEPPPHLGGTPLANGMIRVPLGNVRHTGGPACLDVSQSPCKEIEAWWSVEFGGKEK